MVGGQAIDEQGGAILGRDLFGARNCKAVLGAHVDSPEGRKGIFWSLGRVRAGDTIEIIREDGTTATFSVDRVKAYPKAEFPTDLVYKGDFTRSEIRLVTCGGPVDSRNEYRDNVVVFGHLTSAT